MTLITGDGPGDPPAGLPVIQNLRREIVGGASIIKWNVVAEASPDAFDFGLWFGPTSPVDASGTPDQIVPYYAGQEDYQVVHMQFASEVVVVMAFTPATRSAVAELDMPWDMASIASARPTARPSLSRRTGCCHRRDTGIWTHRASSGIRHCAARWTG
jgi:hypothetical protein